MQESPAAHGEGGRWDLRWVVSERKKRARFCIRALIRSRS